MSKSHHLMCIVLGLVLVAGAGLRRAAAQVTITDIGTINGRSSAGVGINRAGDVAGFSDFTGMVGDLNGTPSQIFLNHGVLFQNGVLHDLGAIEGRPGCASLGCQSQMFAVNDVGWIAGRSDNGTKGWLPVVWLPEASSGGTVGFNILPPIDPDRGGWVNALNNHDQMVGDSVVRGFFRATLWQLKPGGPMGTDLGTLQSSNAGSSLAFSINDFGQVVGAAFDEQSIYQGYLYLPAPAYGLPAGMNNLTSQQFGGDARGINNKGEVTGGLGSGLPWVWLPAPAYGLPAGFSILTMPKDWVAFEPTSISDGGRIVGDAMILVNKNTNTRVIKPAAWSHGRWTLLQDLLPASTPWTIRDAAAVSHVGHTTRITGFGDLAGSIDISGFSPASHGFMLSVTCTGDINDDGIVDQKDLSLLLSHFGQKVTPGTGGDINGDGVVNQQDLLLLGPQVHEPCL